MEPRTERLQGSTRLTRPRPPLLPLPKRRCPACGAWLSQYNLTSLCWCHPAHTDDLNGALEATVLQVLLLSYPQPVNLARYIGLDDRRAVARAIGRLRDKGYVIAGVPGHGHVLHTGTYLARPEEGACGSR